MKFPNPENPAEWQTWYTKDQAYQDSDRRGGAFFVPVLISFIVVLAYLSASQYERLASLSGMLPARLRPWALLVAGILLFVLFLLILYMPAMRATAGFFTRFYLPPKEVDPEKLISYRLFGKSKLPPPFSMFFPFPYVIIREGEIDKKGTWPAWTVRHMGGPIMMIVFDGFALYLERGNRFSRVVGPGEKVPFLEWYETIKYVVDLRPKVKTDSFDVWSKDGIKIKLAAQMTCRIGDPSNNDPSTNLLNPFDPAAVKKAIERYALRWSNRLDGDPEEFTWVNAAWGQVTGIVPGYIGSRMLDDLLMAERQNGQILSPDVMKDLIGKLNVATNAFGVFITDFQIQQMNIPPEVFEHQKDFWLAKGQGIATVKDGEAKAFSIRAREKARAEAQRDLIVAIANGLEKTADGQYTEPLLLALSSVLDEGLGDPLMRAYLARETLETLEQLRSTLEDPNTPKLLEENK
ncbi:MAG: SPFH domain-containing protein [Chloroflexota bacterium]